MILSIASFIHITHILLCFCATAILASMFVTRFGSRSVLMTGSLITAMGYFSASFVSNIDLFFLTYGVISAIGISCMLVASVEPLYHYFNDRIALALGLYMSCWSIGYFTMPPLATVMFSHYGWRGCFIILAGFYLNGIVAGALTRPFRYDTAQKQPAIRETWKVFKNVPFLLFSLFNCLGYVGFSFVSAYLPTVAKGFGSSDTEAALLVSLFGE